MDVAAAVHRGDQGSVSQSVYELLTHWLRGDLNEILLKWFSDYF